MLWYYFSNFSAILWTYAYQKLQVIFILSGEDLDTAQFAHKTIWLPSALVINQEFSKRLILSPIKVQIGVHHIPDWT